MLYLLQVLKFLSDLGAFPQKYPPSRLVLENGYPSEVHNVTTSDGYILRLDRISNPGKPVVFVGNPLLGSAATFLLIGKESLGFRLYDAGFDVWLGNWRGNGLSQNHVNLTNTEPEFWDFSWHEHGVLDAPALMDYVLAATARRRLLYVGYSMGTTAFLVTASELPESSRRRIGAAFLLAPVAFLAHHRQSFMTYFHRYENQTEFVTTLLELPKQFGSDAMPRAIELLSCQVASLTATRNSSGCYSVWGKHLVRPDNLQNYEPVGASAKEILHYSQLCSPEWPGFRRYNYGREGNLKKYGQETPPSYEVGRIAVPTYLYVGKADRVTAPQDVELLVGALGGSARAVYWVPQADFDHVAFCRGRDSPALYDVLLADMMRNAETAQHTQI